MTAYIRDLVIFGANSIEIMPPRTDDDFTSVHMKLPAIRMIAEQSRICKEYGLNVWMWYPNMGSDYTSPDSIKKELDEREKVFSVLPRLDALFVPAGDPGELDPDVLFDGWEKWQLFCTSIIRMLKYGFHLRYLNPAKNGMLSFTNM